jgi:hypothetical protein
MLLGLVGPTRADDTPGKEKRFHIDLLLQRGDPRAAREKNEVLSRPQILTIDRQEARVLVGQTVTIAGEPVDLGYAFRILAESTVGGKVRLRVAAEVGEVVSKGTQEPQARIVQTVFGREMKLGTTLKVRLDKHAKQETWLEVRVQEFKE